MRRASESLTGLLGHPVRMKATGIHSLPISALPALAAPSEAGLMVGLRLRISGEATGQMVILFPLPTILRMLRVLRGTPEEPRTLSDLERSAVQEVGNILASSFLSGLGNVLGRLLMPTPPELHLDDIPGLIQQVMIELEGQGPEIVVVRALFEDPEQKIEGRFFVLPEVAALETMLQSASAEGEDTGREA
jgi:chemotaxis protein CheC